MKILACFVTNTAVCMVSTKARSRLHVVPHCDSSRVWCNFRIILFCLLSLFLARLQQKLRGVLSRFPSFVVDSRNRHMLIIQIRFLVRSTFHLILDPFYTVTTYILVGSFRLYNRLKLDCAETTVSDRLTRHYE